MVQVGQRAAAPESLLFPETRGAIDRGEDRSDGTDAAATEEVEFDAGFVQSAQDARVIRAVGAGARQDQRGAPLR